MIKILLAMLGFFVMVYFMMLHYFPDTQINKYPSFQEVKDDTAIERGWIPAIIPESAYDISETHDLDTNQLFGSFNYKEPDEKKLLEQMTVMPDMNETMEWGNFLFKIDKEHNHVKYRNKADLPRKRN
jgi:hypothetical protein